MAAPEALEGSPSLDGNDEDWARGDYLGLEIPSRPEALRRAGTAFLSRAFRAAGVLDENNGVARITRFEICPGGSTGQKVSISVAYEHPDTTLNTELFVKFSRDFEDGIRDRGKDQLEAEVRFALLSRTPGFPISVPRCYFADYEAASGTGILITECIAFGTGTIEPHYEKCLDYRVPERLEHYRALVTALAHLSGAHKAGRLPDYVEQSFPFDITKTMAGDRITYSAKQLQNRVSRFAAFCTKYPKLFPENITSPNFLSRLSTEVVNFLTHEDKIKEYLFSNPALIALCHWNANIDNAWFWRDANAVLHCGLMDWGRVGQMNVAQALSGALMAADTDIWNEHLGELLRLFAEEFAAAGGPLINARELRRHIALFVGASGLAWLMDAPPMILANIPDLADAGSSRDFRFEANETARTQLHMFTVFLNLWERQDLGSVLAGVTTPGE